MDINKKILGISHSAGEFNGKSYNNYVVFVGFEFPSDNDVNLGIGIVLTDRVKISSDQFAKLLERYDFKVASDLIGSEVDEVFYNQYRQAVSFVLL